MPDITLKRLKTYAEFGAYPDIIEAVEREIEYGTRLSYQRAKILAEAYCHVKRYTDSMRLLARFERQGAQDAFWHSCLGECLLETKQPAKAAMHLERAIELGNQTEETASLLSRAKQPDKPQRKANSRLGEETKKWMEGIPWHRFSTAYGTRASEFLDRFDSLLEPDKSVAKKALDEIEENILNNGMLFPCAPFAIKVLVDIFESLLSTTDQESGRAVASYMLDLFLGIAKLCNYKDTQEHDAPLPHFEDMLDEDYLWSEEYDALEDEEMYDGPWPFDPDLDSSFYYYSMDALETIAGNVKLQSLAKGGDIGKKLKRLLALVSERSRMVENSEYLRTLTTRDRIQVWFFLDSKKPKALARKLQKINGKAKMSVYNWGVLFRHCIKRQDPDLLTGMEWDGFDDTATYEAIYEKGTKGYQARAQKYAQTIMYLMEHDELLCSIVQEEGDSLEWDEPRWW